MSLDPIFKGAVICIEKLCTHTHIRAQLCSFCQFLRSTAKLTQTRLITRCAGMGKECKVCNEVCVNLSYSALRLRN